MALRAFALFFAELDTLAFHNGGDRTKHRSSLLGFDFVNKASLSSPF
jgi:hypothetical protein